MSEDELIKIAKDSLYSDYNPTVIDHILNWVYWIVGIGLGVWLVVEELR